MADVNGADADVSTFDPDVIAPSVIDVRFLTFQIPESRDVSTTSASSMIGVEFDHTLNGWPADPATSAPVAPTVTGTRDELTGLAVRKGALSANPVRDAVSISRQAAELRTLDVAKVVRARTQLAAWDARRTNGGVLRRTDIADPVDLILGTGIRTGEVFALRWEKDVHLVDIPYIKVAGTRKEITGRGDLPVAVREDRDVAPPADPAPVPRRRARGSRAGQ